MILFQVVCFSAGVIALYFGAEFFIKGASTAARALRVTPLLIGLVVVSSATSAPELLVCLLAAMKESGDLAMGNIIGSNIANIGLILGVSALIAPIRVKLVTIRRELSMMLAASVIFVLLSVQGILGRVEGVIFIVLLLIVFWVSIKAARAEHRENGADSGSSEKVDVKSILFLSGGMGGLLGGAQLVVSSGIELARAAGISELVIGLSVIAVGTSLPELAASVSAARRGESDLCVGNVMGSNIFNMLLVIGLVAILVPVRVTEEMLIVHLPVMLIFSFALLPIMKTGFIINRVEGAGLLVAYFVYVGVIYT